MTSENTKALPTVGLIGLGNLGNPMAVSALSYGYPMVVHSLNKAEAENLIALGATWANSAAEVGNKSDIVITVLPAPHHVRDIMIGSGGVLEQMKPGSTFIDMSTSSVEVANEIKELAFDHFEILQAAKDKLKQKIKIQPIGFNLLPEKFTLSQLHRLYESILDKPLDKRNFRRKIQKLDILTSLREKQRGVPHKPSLLYKFNEEKYQELTQTGFDNFGF